MSDYLEQILDRFDPEEYQSYDWENIDDPSKLGEVGTEIPREYEQKERGGAIFAVNILSELHHLSEEAHSSIEMVKDRQVERWGRDEKDDIDLFFSFVGQAQEHLLREAVIQHIFADKVVTDEIKMMIHGAENYRGYGHHQCLQILEAGEVIDDGLKGEIGQVRSERNEAVHDITRWLFAEFDPEDIESQVNRGERSVVRLLELVYGFDLE